jgi:L-ascorbate metabolism protein UlaG (beta-lactamase superfamily)
MELKWLGHASWKVKTDGYIIFLDPYEGDYDEVADLVLVSHGHSDHCDVGKIAKVTDEDTVIIAPAECQGRIEAPIVSLEKGQKYEMNSIGVEAVEAYNFKRFRSPGEPYHPRGLGVGYIIRSEGKTIYHVGDTDFVEEMKDIKGLDVMLVAIGGTYTMDNDDAIDAVLAVNPRVAIPMHIWDTDPSEFERRVESVSDIEVVVLSKGESYTL